MQYALHIMSYPFHTLPSTCNAICTMYVSKVHHEFCEECNMQYALYIMSYSFNTLPSTCNAMCIVYVSKVHCAFYEKCNMQYALHIMWWPLPCMSFTSIHYMLLKKCEVVTTFYVASGISK